MSTLSISILIYKTQCLPCRQYISVTHKGKVRLYGDPVSLCYPIPQIPSSVLRVIPFKSVRGARIKIGGGHENECRAMAVGGGGV